MGELTMNTVKTGGVQMVPIDGQFHVWTKRIGAGPATMLTLHGGPGCTHEYFECFEDFLPPAGIQLIYYDQLGSAYSDQPDEPSLWTVERFREEMEQVRAALGLNQFYLYGHSWGGMLALEYALKYQEHLKGLVISNMTASIASYVTYINELRRQLPAESLRILERYEANGEYTAPEYEKVMIGEIYSKHLCRLAPWPEPMARMFRHMNQKVYNTMQGPNEFVVTGTFKDWDRWADLKSINVPTLLSVGRFDTMNVADIERMGSLIPNARVAICENGSHCSMYDDQERYFEGLLRFVKDVEAGEFAA
jgi:proline iminopeptidase